MPIVFALCTFVALSPPIAEVEEQSETEPPISLSVKGSYVHLFNRSRESHSEDKELLSGEDMGGFTLSYTHALIPNWLSLQFAKPFYFAPDRFDSPFEFLIRFNHKLHQFELLAGIGTTLNVRVLDQEGEEQEGVKNDVSFGIASLLGIAYWLHERWAIELESSYAYIPIGVIVEHEPSVSLGPVFAF